MEYIYPKKMQFAAYGQFVLVWDRTGGTNWDGTMERLREKK